MVPSDSHFSAYEQELVKMWFHGDSDSAAKQFSDSGSVIQNVSKKTGTEMFSTRI
jgi:hypothetical protein